MKRLLPLSLLAAGFALATSAQAATLLNVSYDVMRDFYKDYNAAFQKHWQAEGGQPLQIQMSHGGSSKQARAVIDGLAADVITMNMATDINALAEICKSGHGLAEQRDTVPLTKEHVPDQTAGAPVSLVSIFHHRGVRPTLAQRAKASGMRHLVQAAIHELLHDFTALDEHVGSRPLPGDETLDEHAAVALCHCGNARQRFRQVVLAHHDVVGCHSVICAVALDEQR